MRKSIVFIFSLAAMLAACNDGPKREQLIGEIDSLRNVIVERDASLDEMIATINVVEEGFRSINEAQGRININTAGLEKNTDRLKENFAFISNTLTKNKEEIERLKKQLNQSHTNSKQLKIMLDNLQTQLIEKSREIETMHEILAQKNIHIADLDKAVAELTEKNNSSLQKIDEQDKQLNAVWYAIGTKRELKGEKILVDGKVLNGTETNMDYFTQVDMRELASVPTHSKRAKLLTTHPEGSYTLVRDENKMYTLNITDPQAFWSVSRYLVIQVR